MQIEYKTRGIRSMMVAPENDKTSLLEAERQNRRRAETDLAEAGRTIEQLRTRLAFAEAALSESRQRVDALSAELHQRQEPAVVPVKPRVKRQAKLAAPAGQPIWHASWAKVQTEQ